MSLDIYLYECVTVTCPSCQHVHDLKEREVPFWDTNLTHNLSQMANEAGLYEALWRPDELVNPAEASVLIDAERVHNWTAVAEIRKQFKVRPRARDLIPLLRVGLERLRADPARFQALNPENGWGTYAGFVPWVERYLAQCEAHPGAYVRVTK